MGSENPVSRTWLQTVFFPLVPGVSTLLEPVEEQVTPYNQVVAKCRCRSASRLTCSLSTDAPANPMLQILPATPRAPGHLRRNRFAFLCMWRLIVILPTPAQVEGASLYMKQQAGDAQQTAPRSSFRRSSTAWGFMLAFTPLSTPCP